MEKRMDDQAGRMRPRGASRGETLVETIVAFSVLMILLTMVLSVIRSGIALNNRAVQNLAALSADCAAIELLPESAAPLSTAMLTLTYTGGTVNVPADGAFDSEQELNVYGGDILYSFRAQIEEEGNGA